MDSMHDIHDIHDYHDTHSHTVHSSIKNCIHVHDAPRYLWLYFNMKCCNYKLLQVHACRHKYMHTAQTHMYRCNVVDKCIFDALLMHC